MASPLEASAPARLPSPADNVAIATRRIDVGTVLILDGVPRTLAHTVLEGHRFAVRPIAKGTPLLSWGMPFGLALRDIAAGEYVANAMALEALAHRDTGGAQLPAAANFENRIVPFAFDAAAFVPAAQVPVRPDDAAETFLGYPREQGRGVGTRNYIVILGTTSRTASYARELAERLQPLVRENPGFDGIVPIAHTEGDIASANNLEELARTLAGFMVNPNVGAVLAVDAGTETMTNARLRAFMVKQGYPLAAVPHHFFTLAGGNAAALAAGEAIVRAWVPLVAAQRRQPTPLSGLRIGLQCGGSDAFSGISANPLLGVVGKEVIRHGGAINLAETDELIGAESYILSRVKDLATAQAFLAKIARFKERLGWHGSTVEGNPSAGNRLRGLYNIVLKSLGAAMKKDPETRLDHVIDYAQLMRAPGFYFMDSPGNDLESIAGQIGAGCNMLFFTTGNGSITNFPFVPTIKVTTTTRRHQLLINEMDVNAGTYLEGQAMSALAADMFGLVRAIASGQRSKGELAGHSQVSIWRNWRQSDATQIAAIRAKPVPTGEPLPLLPSPAPLPAQTFPAFATAAGGRASDRLGLVLPTSLCSSQIARLAADRLNQKGIGRSRGIARFVALPHTEGCGFSGDNVYQLLQRTYSGYVRHPAVATALFLEHGCEKIPNDIVRHYLAEQGVDPERFGWASVQLDGGIEKVLAKVEAWFAARVASLPPATRTPAGLDALSLGLLSDGPVGAAAAETLGGLAQLIVGAGGSVLLPATSALLAAPAFRARTIGSAPVRSTLTYGQALVRPGFHVVETESDHWVENLTGLGGCGAQTILALVRGSARQGHPFIPVIQVAEADARPGLAAEDIDGFLSGNAEQDLATVLALVLAVAGGEMQPAATAQRMVDFQFTRGLLGVST